MWLPQFSMRGLLLAVVPFAVSAAMWPLVRQFPSPGFQAVGLVLIGSLATSSLAWLTGAWWMRDARYEPDDHQPQREEVFRFAAGNIVAVYGLVACYAVLYYLDQFWKSNLAELPKTVFAGLGYPTFFALAAINIFALAMINITIFWRAVATFHTFEFRCPHDRDISLVIMRLASIVTAFAALSVQLDLLL